MLSPFLFSSALEDDSHPCLDFALTVYAQAGDCTESSVVYISIRLVELWSIGDVEEVAAETDLDALGYSERLAYIQIHFFNPASRKWISRGIARGNGSTV